MTTGSDRQEQIAASAPSSDLRVFAEGIVERWDEAKPEERTQEATMLASLATSWLLYHKALQRIGELNPRLLARSMP